MVAKVSGVGEGVDFEPFDRGIPAAPLVPVVNDVQFNQVKMRRAMNCQKKNYPIFFWQSMRRAPISNNVVKSKFNNSWSISGLKAEATNWLMTDFRNEAYYSA